MSVINAWVNQRVSLIIELVPQPLVTFMSMSLVMSVELSITWNAISPKR